MLDLDDLLFFNYMNEIEKDDIRSPEQNDTPREQERSEIEKER